MCGKTDTAYNTVVLNGPSRSNTGKGPGAGSENRNRKDAGEASSAAQVPEIPPNHLDVPETHTPRFRDTARAFGRWQSRPLAEGGGEREKASAPPPDTARLPEAFGGCGGQVVAQGDGTVSDTQTRSPVEEAAGPTEISAASVPGAHLPSPLQVYSLKTSRSPPAEDSLARQREDGGRRSLGVKSGIKSCFRSEGFQAGFGAKRGWGGWGGGRRPEASAQLKPKRRNRVMEGRRRRQRRQQQQQQQRGCS